ncbi:MAG: hypothetical protein KQ78_01449 [Candidatus Izimaplasma bacterium HR2]|nr:MAG: hypothetical protein KQ78_01449 [Candidatus Izimaplasma bacterium HR2]
MNIIKQAFEDRILRHLFFAVVIYVPLSIVIAFETLAFLNIMLGWNVILAFVPVVLAFIFYNKSLEDNDKQQDKVILILLFLSWLFFFPNAFYLITDFIHLGGEEFYYWGQLYSPITYTENYLGYLTLAHIFLGAFIGVFMAIYSLRMIDIYLINKFGNMYSTLIIILIMFLSSIGIYIGRFLRLNSWDVLNPFNVLEQLFDSLNRFSFEFIMIFIVIQLALYYLLKPFIRIND